MDNPTTESDRLNQLRDLSDRYSQIENSYLFSHITPANSQILMSENKLLKHNGVTLVLILKGEMTLDINTESHKISGGSILFLSPNDIVTQTKPVEVEAYILSFNQKFLQNVNINLTSITIPPLYSKPISILPLTEEETDILKRYFDLLYINSSNPDNTQINNIATSIIAAMFYQIVDYYHRRIDSPDGVHTLSRRHDYVRDFIKLVHIHYTRERSVSFYASKLFITPKYLSLLIKEATGRSAADWIDQFVVMEAKNMLKFSGKNIQQVAYALNFNTQSSFGKYFKHLTGMSPSEYQKS